MNQVNLIGNIGVEPTITTFASGKKVIRFSVALFNGFSHDGAKKEPTWIACESWDDTVERFIKCSEKGGLRGRRIQITGRLAVSKYPRHVGQESYMHHKIYVKVTNFSMLSYNQVAEDTLPQVAESMSMDSEEYNEEPAEVAIA